jgi:hypothetical protein
MPLSLRSRRDSPPRRAGSASAAVIHHPGTKRRRHRDQAAGNCWRRPVLPARQPSGSLTSSSDQDEAANRAPALEEYAASAASRRQRHAALPSRDAAGPSLSTATARARNATQITPFCAGDRLRRHASLAVHIGGSARVLPPFAPAQWDALGPRSPMPTLGAVGVSNLLAAASRHGCCACALGRQGATSCPA